MRKRLTTYWLLFMCLLTMQGCFDIRREIKIYPNGSGSEKVYVTVESAVFDIFKIYASQDKTGMAQKKIDSLMDNGLWQQAIMNDFQKAPGISLKDAQVTSKGDGSKEIFIHYTFDEPSALIKTVKEVTFDMSNQQNVNFTSLKFFDEGDALRFKYVLRNASRSYDDSVALNLFSNLIQSKRASFSIDMPFDVESSNATSQSGNVLYWDFSINDILYNEAEMTAVMKRDPGLNLPYAEKVDKSVQTVSRSKNPLIRIQLYNANKEPSKIGTGIVLKDGLMVTNFKLLTLFEGQGYFSIILPNDSLAGVDEMRETDYDQKLDIAFFRFNNIEPVKTLKFAEMSGVKVADNVKIFYYPNPLSPIVYSMDGKVTNFKAWGKKNKVIEIKPAKPLSLEGGAVFNEKGDLMGLITTAFEGEVGKLYIVPSDYIRAKFK